MNRQSRPYLRYAWIILAAWGVLFLLEQSGGLRGADHYFYDLCFRLRGPRPTDSRIVIVAIDEATFKQTGRWPIRRSHYRGLLEALTDAKAVGFDIIFAESSPDDGLLAEAMIRQGRVVLPLYFDQRLELSAPAQPFAAAKTGHVHLEQDIDGVVRRVYHTLLWRGKRLPSFASALYALGSDRRLSATAPPESSAAGEQVITQKDPMTINYYGPRGSFPSVSWSDILAGKRPASFFSGKIVLIGLTAPGLTDGALTPFTQDRNRTPGVEIHANLLNNLLDESAIAPIAAGVKWFMAAGVFALGLGLFLKFGGLRAGLLWILALATIPAAVFLLFAGFNRWLPPSLLGLSATTAFVIAYIAHLERMGRKLQQAQRDWAESFDTITDAIVIQDSTCRLVQANHAARHVFGDRLLEWLDQRCLQVHRSAGDPAGGRPAVSEPALEEVFLPESGTHLEVKSLTRTDTNHRFKGMVHVVRDITQRKTAEDEQCQLQSQLIQAQKMEAVGRLAGGIAHDFNNILSAIMGYSELALMRLPSEDKLHRQLTIIRESGEKAAGLIRRLLTFSRKQPMEMQTVDPKAVVENIGRMLLRMIGEDILLEFDDCSSTRTVAADGGQLEQVLMNLAVNARDAMPTGGRLRIQTADCDVDETYAAKYPTLTPGAYVMLSVSDTGTGMLPEVQERIFEPFFTTKEKGKGTGLGLATVYGIIQQHRGYIFVESKPGGGAIFRIFMPVGRAGVKAPRVDSGGSVQGGTETVLIVEDDPGLRELVADILKSLGYRVITAAGAEEALKLGAEWDAPIELLLTDVVMPVLNGRQVAEAMQVGRPEIKVLFMSGYGEEAIEAHGMNDDRSHFIQKPFTPAELAAKVRAALDPPSLPA